MIRSHHNPLLKEIRRLNAGRRDGGRFVAEGEDLVQAAEQAGWAPVHLLRAGVEVDGDALAKVSGLGSSSRVLGVYEERWSDALGPLCVALWGVGDPGNVGTILRGAVAFGVSSVVIGPHTADPYSPKAVRASMGAIFQVAVARARSVDELPGQRIALISHASAPLRGPVEADATIVIGAEREGLPPDVVQACDTTGYIPIGSESLNAAMAATVALYELTRDRANRVADQ